MAEEDLHGQKVWVNTQECLGQVVEGLQVGVGQ